MRLAGQEKMGYYPTPPRVVDMIRERLDFGTAPFAALDPCAGEGNALQQLCWTGTGEIMDPVAPGQAQPRSFKRSLYGIEPDRGRASIAMAALDHVLISTLEEATIARQSFSLLFLNPPYDAEHETAADHERTGKKTVRKERAFLQRCLPYLAPRGVLVFIVPRHIFDADTIAYLSTRFDNLEIWDFPEPEREQFKQAVAIGTRTEGKRINPSTVDITDGPPLDAPLHTVPPSNPQVKIFRTSRLDPATLKAASPKSSLWDFFRPRTEQAQHREPPLALHSGHLGLLLAAGCADGIVGTGAERHLVRGKTAKLLKSSTETTVNPETGTTTTTTRKKDQYVIGLKVLRPTGEILELR